MTTSMSLYAFKLGPLNIVCIIADDHNPDKYVRNVITSSSDEGTSGIWYCGRIASIACSWLISRRREATYMH